MEPQHAIALPRVDAPLSRGRSYPGLAGLEAGGGRSGAADAATYTVAVYTAQLLLFVGGVLQKRLLGPNGAGYWALMTTFALVLNLAPLGAVDGAGRQIPFHRGRGDHAGAAAIADTSSSFGLAATTLAGLVGAAVAVAFGSGWSPEIRYGIVLLGVIAPLGELRDAHDGIMQATKRFRVTSIVVIVQAVVTITLQTLLVALAGYYGMFAGQVVIALSALLVWNRLGLTSISRPAFRWRIERRRLRELIHFGLPMMLQGQLWVLFLAIDNLIVAGFLSVTELGYYALACSATTYVMLLPKGVGGALGPRMAERYGATQDAGWVGSYGAEVQRVLGYVLIPLLVGAAFYLMPVLIRHALPAFLPAIPVLRIVVAGSFFISLTTIPIKVLLTSGYRWSVTVITLVALGFNALVNYIAVAVLHDGLKGAAVAVAISYFGAFAAMTTFAEARTRSVRSAVRTLIAIILAFAYLSAAMWTIEMLFGASAPGLVPDALLGLLKLAVLTVTLSPWMFLIERRSGAISTSASMLNAAVAKLKDRRRHE